MPERFGLWRRLLKSALSVFCLSESELDTVHAELRGFSCNSIPKKTSRHIGELL